MTNKISKIQPNKKLSDLNIVFLSFRDVSIESAGAKRTFFQAKFLNKFEDVSYVVPKKSHQKNIGNINSHFGVYNSFSQLKKLRNKFKKNILIIDTIIELKHFPFVVFAKYFGYKIVFDKVENFKYFEDKKTLSNWLNINFGLFLENWLNYFADGLLVISTQLYQIYKNKNLPIIIMPNSIYIDNVNLTSKTRFNKPVKILYSGSFGLKDGVDLLLKAFFRLVENYKDEVQLHLVGRGTPKNELLIKKQIKGNKHIIWHGFVSNKELDSIQLNSDILAMTRIDSKFAQYGFPYKITEYLKTGNTIIATKIGDIDVFLKDKVSAILTEPNIDSIYKSLDFCMNNEKKAISIGKKGQTISLKQFDITTNGKKLLKFLHSI